MSRTAEALLRQAQCLIDEADRIEENYIEEPSFEDGTGLIMFEKQYQQGGRVYVYAAVRVPNMNVPARHLIREDRWFVSGSVAMNGRYGYTWDQVLEFIQQGYEWRIWNASEVIELASSQA